MAQYRLEVQTIQRSAGRSAVAAAAYRSGDRLIDERLAMEFDFGAKGDIEFAAIMAPTDAPAAFGDRQTLWNAAEAAENRKDAAPARELLVSLPHELDFVQRRALVEAFVAASRTLTVVTPDGATVMTAVVPDWLIVSRLPGWVAEFPVMASPELASAPVLIVNAVWVVTVPPVYVAAPVAAIVMRVT